MDASTQTGSGAQFSKHYNKPIEEEDELMIESGTSHKLGEERSLGTSGIKKKLLKYGVGWETPQIGDEVTVHYVGEYPDGKKFYSTRDNNEPVSFKIGEAKNPKSLEKCVQTMKLEEQALFTLPAQLCYGGCVSPNSSVLHYTIELILLISVVDVTKEGIIKKVFERGIKNGPSPNVLDEVLVRYQVELNDGTIVAKTPFEGIEFCVKAGHLCQALPLAIVTMKTGEKARLIVQPQYGFQGGSSSGEIKDVPPNSVLNIDVELVSFKRVVDILGDSKLVKKILREGQGRFGAEDGAIVTVSYVAKLEDGTVFERKGTEGDVKFLFVTDEDQVISGLDMAAATMKKGEKAVVTISHEYGFGNVEVERQLAKVPKCSTLIYEVEMFDFVKENPWEMTNTEKIKAATRKKEEGNMLFKNHQYQRAARRYQKAAACVETRVFNFENDELKQAKVLRVSSLLNGAACGLKVKNFPETIKLCSKVLEIECENVKALYRRTQAYMEMGDLISGEVDIKKALEADPENREVKTLYRTLKQSQAESNKGTVKLFGNFFAPAEVKAVGADEEEDIATKVEAMTFTESEEGEKRSGDKDEEVKKEE